MAKIIDSRYAGLLPKDALNAAWGWSVAGFALGVALLVIGFWPSWRGLYDVWMGSETYSHGIVIAPLALWLVWRMRHWLGRLTPQPTAAGLLALIGALALWAVGELAQVNLVRGAAVVAMIVALALLMFGWRVCRLLAFPLAFLFFMVPVGEGMVPWLMDGTADATVAALRLSGIPVYREGLHFMLPSGRWSVVEACSGLRYVIAAAVLSTLFAFFNFRHLRKALLFVGISLFISILANWVRAYLVVMIGHFSHMRYGTGDDHVVYGWVFFGVVMFVIFWMGTKWTDPDRWTYTPRAVADASLAGVGTKASRFPVVMGLCSLVVLVVASSSLVAIARDVTPRSNVAQLIEDKLRPLDRSPLVFEPIYDGATTVVQGTLSSSPPLQFYVAYFARQYETGEMIRFGNLVLATGNKEWPAFQQGTRSVNLAGTTITVREKLIRSGSDQRVVWYWYTVGGRSTSSEYAAKLLTLISMVMGRGDHSIVNVLVAGNAGNVEEARAALLKAATTLDQAGRAITMPDDQRR